MSYLDTTIEEIKTQTGLLEFYKAIYEKLPEGRLTTKVVNGRLFYYRVDKNTQKATYIPNHKKHLIFQLKQKRWLEESIKIMENNLKVQEKVLKQYKDYRAHSVEERLSRSYHGGTLEQYEKEYLIDLRDWAEDSYRKNPYHEENLRYETSFGLRVRSKSELIIAELLHKYGIPFRYDAKVRVRGKGGYWKTYYVDFLIMTPSAGVVLGFFMALLRNPILSLYPIETEGSRSMASALLLFYSCWLCLRMIPYTAICGIFRAGGDTRIGCIYDVGILYGFGIPLVCLAGLVWKLPFLWIVMLMFAAEDIPKSILCIRHFLRRKWIIRLTEDTAAQPDTESP